MSAPLSAPSSAPQSAPSTISEQSLARLNPVGISEPNSVASLLDRIVAERIELWRGTNRHAVKERAWFLSVTDDCCMLATKSFDGAHRDQIFLNFELDGVRYFFSAMWRGKHKDGLLEIARPGVIYQTERRDRSRDIVSKAKARERQLTLVTETGLRFEGEAVDSSAEGLAVRVSPQDALREGAKVRIEFSQVGDRARFGEVRHLSEPEAETGWRTIGLAMSWGPSRERIRVEHPTPSRSLPAIQGPLPAPGHGFESRFVRYENEFGEEIRAVVDVVGDARGAPTVIIPPAWGRTKESLLALSETICATFHAAGSSVCVLRFDGIRRRGESANDPECAPPVGENMHYTFSQGARDILTTLDFLERSRAHQPSRIVLATFSIAAVEGRRAIVLDPRKRIDAWVSVVGASDPQSMIRIVSGGVDYFAGASKGLEFGVQYIQGMLLDIDRVASDALDCGIGFLEDSRRDMAAIDIPLTWIYGTHDAWTELERVRDMLSSGDTSRRRLLELPTGHQLRSSRDALVTFECVAAEIARLALDRAVSSVSPDNARIRERRKQERRGLNARRQRPAALRPAAQRQTLQRFWRDYLVGLDGRLGIEIVSSTSAYRQLMRQQIEALAPRSGEILLDLGSGAGPLPLELLDGGRSELPRIVAIDLVPEALRRSRLRLEQALAGSGSDTRAVPGVSRLAANLDPGRDGAGIPLADASVDAVLASLLLNYLLDPRELLREIARVLRPGGRLVFSGMRPDADVSKICVEGVEEVRTGQVKTIWSQDGLDNIDQPLQEFISSGARLLDLEEEGAFAFWSEDEMRALIDPRLFTSPRLQSGYGDPPQALILSVERTGELCNT